MNMRTPGRLLLGFAGLLLLAGGAFHGLAYPKALAMIGASDLSARGAAMYEGLWLNDAATVALLGGMDLLLALKPTFATRVMLALLSALPLAGALAIYVTVGSFLPGHLLLAASILAALAAVTRESDRGNPGIARGALNPQDSPRSAAPAPGTRECAAHRRSLPRSSSLLRPALRRCSG